MVKLKLRHDEYNYVIHNLTVVETKEDQNKHKMEDMVMKIDVSRQSYNELCEEAGIQPRLQNS